MPRGQHRQRGLTFIEITIAAAIIAMLAAGVMSSLSMAYAADRVSQDIITSHNVAQNVIESTEVTPFEGLLALDGATVDDGRFIATLSVSLVELGLIRVETHVVCNDNPSVDTRVVTLRADAN